MSTELTAEELTKQGYRRISNKYGIVARVDRPDWWVFLEQHFGRNMPIHTDSETGSWADHYRRCFSKDRLEVGPEIGGRVPGSGWDATGYVDPNTGCEDVKMMYKGIHERIVARGPRPIYMGGVWTWSDEEGAEMQPFEVHDYINPLADERDRLAAENEELRDRQERDHESIVTLMSARNMERERAEEAEQALNTRNDVTPG